MARWSAAWPLAVQTAPTPPSSAAIRSSSTATVGIADAAVDVPGGSRLKSAGGLIGVAEDIGRRLIDRHRAGAGQRVDHLPGMERQRVELRKLRIDHRRHTPASIPARSLSLNRCGEQASPENERGAAGRSRPRARTRRPALLASGRKRPSLPGLVRPRMLAAWSRASHRQEFSTRSRR